MSNSTELEIETIINITIKDNHFSLTEEVALKLLEVLQEHFKGKVKVWIPKPFKKPHTEAMGPWTRDPNEEPVDVMFGIGEPDGERISLDQAKELAGSLLQPVSKADQEVDSDEVFYTRFLSTYCDAQMPCESTIADAINGLPARELMNWMYRNTTVGSNPDSPELPSWVKHIGNLETVMQIIEKEYSLNRVDENV